MRTAMLGSFAINSFVASSPSRPGIRTSMITTLGFRRSASSIAAFPSPASPTTRMWEARDNERRNPSRTTSWSSTIRHVISLGIKKDRTLTGRTQLHRERQLHRLRRRLELRPAAVADAVLARKTRNLDAYGLGHRLRKIRAAARVEFLVTRQFPRPVARQGLEKMLARAGPQVEQARPDPRRARR